MSKLEAEIEKRLRPFQDEVARLCTIPGHAILVIAFHLLKRKANYLELGSDYFDQKNAEVLKRSLVRRLERLGHSVTPSAVAQLALVFVEVSARMRAAL